MPHALLVVLRRLPSALFSLSGVFVVTFVLTHALPADPAAYLAGPSATLEAVDEIRKQLGLDLPVWSQFVRYVVDVAHGELGMSWATGQPVLDELVRRIPASLELTLSGLVLAVVVAIPLGILAALKPGSWIDHLTRVVTTAGVSLPVFFTGLLLVYVFYYLLGWAPPPLGRLPAFASAPPTLSGLMVLDALLDGDLDTASDALCQLVLPALTLGTFALAPIARMTRASMLQALSSDFVRTARAAGLPSWKVIGVYALQNAMLPVLTTLGMVFSFLLGANVLVEKVFAWPGVGSFALEGLMISDYAAVQGFVLAMGSIYVLLNLAVDLTYGLVDPRMQVES